MPNILPSTVVTPWLDSLVPGDLGFALSWTDSTAALFATAEWALSVGEIGFVLVACFFSSFFPFFFLSGRRNGITTLELLACRKAVSKMVLPGGALSSEVLTSPSEACKSRQFL